MLLSLTEFDFAFTGESLILKCKTESQARDLIWHYTNVFAKWARQFEKQSVKITYPNRKKKYFEVLATMGGDEEETPVTGVLAPGIHFDRSHIPIPVLKALFTLLEHPDEKWALVRMSKDMKRQTQIAMSEACRSLVKNATLESAIGRQRSEYWHLPDLEDLNRRTRQELEPNNPESVIMVPWKGVDVPTRREWREFTHQYWLIETDDALYHLSKNLGVRQVAAPVGAR